MSEIPTTTLTAPIDENIPWQISEADFTFPTDLILSGKLPSGRKVHDLKVRVRHENEEYSVIELQFSWLVVRKSFKLAIIHHVMNLSDYYDYLLSEEPTLGNYLRKELEFLKVIFKQE